MHLRDSSKRPGPITSSSPANEPLKRSRTSSSQHASLVRTQADPLAASPRSLSAEAAQPSGATAAAASWARGTKCTHCSKDKFKSQEVYNTHVSHCLFKTSTAAARKAAPQDEDEFVCHKCQRDCKNHPNLQKHMRSEHPAIASNAITSFFRPIDSPGPPRPALLPLPPTLVPPCAVDDSNALIDSQSNSDQPIRVGCSIQCQTDALPMGCPGLRHSDWPQPVCSNYPYALHSNFPAPPWAASTSGFFTSDECTGTAPPGQACCAKCANLAYNSQLAAVLVRARLESLDSHYNHIHLTHQQLKARAQQLRVQSQRQDLSTFNSARTLVSVDRRLSGNKKLLVYLSEHKIARFHQLIAVCLRQGRSVHAILQKAVDCVEKLYGPKVCCYAWRRACLSNNGQMCFLCGLDLVYVFHMPVSIKVFGASPLHKC